MFERFVNSAEPTSDPTRRAWAIFGMFLASLLVLLAASLLYWQHQSALTAGALLLVLGLSVWALVDSLRARRRLEEFQRGSREWIERLSKVAGHVPGVIYQFQRWPDGRCTFPYASAGTVGIFGVTPEVLREDARPAFAALHPEDAEAVRASIDVSANTLGVWREVYRSCRPDGRVLWLEGVATPELLEDGSVLWHGYLSDVSERHELEAQLKAQNQRLHDIISGTDAGTWEWQVQTGEVRFNERWAEIVGYRLEELAPLSIDTWVKLAHPDDLLESNALLSRHFAGTSPLYEFECRMRHKQGHWVWVLDRGRVSQWTAEGKPLLMSGTHVDISERRAMLARLEESEQRFRDYSQAGSDWFWEMDRDLRFSFFSDNAALLLGSALEEMRGRTLEELLARQDLDAADKGAFYLQTLVARHPFRGFEYHLADRHGGYWLAISGLPVFAADGTFQGYRGAGSDISARKTIEADMLRARQSAENADKAKTAFLATMSHEIRTPLNALVGMSYLLSQSALSTQQRKDLNSIVLAGKSLLALIDNILDFSKIEAGELALDPHPFSLFALLDEIKGMFSALARARGIEFVLRPIAANVPGEVMGDSQRLRQMLVNLIGNAIKFTPEGQVSLAVSLVPEQIHHDKFLLRFIVADTGIGMDRITIGRLFRPFSQGDASTARKFGGTGLGLSIVRRLAHLMGGEISAGSLPGRGSNFGLRLPFQKVPPGVKVTEIAPFRGLAMLPESAEVDSMTTENLAVDAPAGCLGGLRVLVVDDSELNLDVVGRILQLQGAQPTLCASGVAALDVVATDAPFDVVLMDLQMPDLDGYETALRLRQLASGKDVPVIALTAGATAEGRGRAGDVGMVDFLTKPVDPERLVEAICRHVDHLPVCAPGGANLHSSSGDMETSPGWPVVDGVSLQEVRRRLGDDLEFYAGLVGRFIAEIDALSPQIGEALAHADAAAAVAPLHRLRGQAGYVGAVALGQRAGNLETAALAATLDRAPIESLLASARDIQRSLSEWLASRRAPDIAADASAETTVDRETFNQFLEQLAGQDLAAMNSLRKLHNALGPWLGDATLAAVDEAVSGLNFKLALKKLQDAGAIDRLQATERERG